MAPHPTPIDAALVARIRAGDESAFETLFYRYHDALYRFAYGFLRRRDLVDDVLQEVFFRVWERRAEWVIFGTAQAYLYTAVRNRAIRVLRRGRVVAAHADAYTFEGDSRPDAPDVAAESADLNAALDRALGTLAERTREVFVLHRRHNLSYAEIASVRSQHCVPRASHSPCAP